MIEITRLTDRITVKGHAGYAPVGQDIVCAAVSTLFQTLVWSIEELAGDKIKYEFADGRSWIKRDGNLSEDVYLLMRSFFIGIEAIRDAYPEYVRIDNGNGLGAEVNDLGQKG
jgi:uncharacterized protein